jgi:hypothetical protein
MAGHSANFPLVKIEGLLAKWGSLKSRQDCTEPLDTHNPYSRRDRVRCPSTAPSADRVEAGVADAFEIGAQNLGLEGPFEWNCPGRQPGS